MRNFIIGIALVACGIMGVPAAAQAAVNTQPATPSEVQRLNGQRTTGLDALRGGNDAKRSSMDVQEREAFAQLAAERPQSEQMLRELRGGHWFIYISVPVVVVALVVVIILLIVLA
jgi:hypothetical protein